MKTLLTVAACIALAVGFIAIGFPIALLESKGAAPTPATVVWVREVGVNIFALGVMSLLARGHAPSPTLRAFFVGNAVVQFGLLPIELLAWQDGTLTRLSGVVPNSVVHLALGSAFAFFAARPVGVIPPAGSSPSSAART